MNRQQKQQFIHDFAEKIEKAGAMIVAQYKGLNVKDIQELRKKFKQQNGDVVVAKNRLVKKIVENKPIKDIAEKLNGQLLYAFTKEPTDAPKIATEFQKNNEKFQIVTGIFQNKVIDKKQIANIAKLPPMEQIRANIIRALQAPAARIIALQNANQNKIFNLINQYANK